MYDLSLNKNKQKKKMIAYTVENVLVWLITGTQYHGDKVACELTKYRLLEFITL